MDQNIHDIKIQIQYCSKKQDYKILREIRISPIVNIFKVGMYSIQNDEIYTIENLVEIMLKIVL